MLEDFKSSLHVNFSRCNTKKLNYSVVVG
jgi:hypothetical protein